MTNNILSPNISNTFNISNTNINNDNIDIEYNIPSINYNGIMGGDINEVINNFKNMINSEIINNYSDYNYYIQEESNDFLPSPFSHSNTVNCVVPNILHNIANYNKDKLTLKIRFYPESKNFDFFDNKKNPTFMIEIINLNY